MLLVNVPVGIAATLVALWGVPADRPAGTGRRVDWLGFATFTFGLLGLVYGISRAGETSWGDGLALGTLIAGLVLLTVFVLIEARVKHPIFDLSLLRAPAFTGGLTAALAMNGSLFALFVYCTIHLQNGLGLAAGFIVAGIGSGLVNPPLASTAVGVVPRIPPGWHPASTPPSA